MYDLIIIGGGPAGISAGIYAARKKIKTLLITPEIGGQSTISESIENWIGTPKISGRDLADSLKKHILTYSKDSIEINENESVLDINKNDNIFYVKTDKSEYRTKTILIATGSHRRKLEIIGAEKFDNKGVTYCASCDGPLFSGQDVVVIGGGNAGLESSAQLLAYCKSVTLLNRSEVLRGDEITISKLLENKNFKIIKNAIPIEIKGDKFVSSIVYEDALTKEKVEIETPAVFVEIGLLPVTSFAKNILQLNEYNQIPVNPKNQQTNISGIWSAGDCTDALYHQNNIASGDAVKALEDIYLWLKTK